MWGGATAGRLSFGALETAGSVSLLSDIAETDTVPLRACHVSLPALRETGAVTLTGQFGYLVPRLARIKGDLELSPDSYSSYGHSVFGGHVPAVDFPMLTTVDGKIQASFDRQARSDSASVDFAFPALQTAGGLNVTGGALTTFVMPALETLGDVSFQLSQPMTTLDLPKLRRRVRSRSSSHRTRRRRA